MELDDRPAIPLLEGQTTIEEAIRAELREKSTVKIQTDTIVERHTFTRTVIIEGAEPIEFPRLKYDRPTAPKKRFAPDQVTIAWDEGETPRRATVSGLQIRKDGTKGAARLRAVYPITALPEWLDLLLAGAEDAEQKHAFAHGEISGFGANLVAP